MVGPLLGHVAHAVQTSPMGLVPKNNSNKFHLVVDLSSPVDTVSTTASRQTCVHYITHMWTQEERV